MKTISSLLIGIVASFCVSIYVPTVSYLANVNEFAFNGYDLFRQLLPLFFALLALLFVVARFCKNILPTCLIPLGRRKICVSPFDVFLVFLLLCLWVEGSLLSRDLPAFDGGIKLFASIPRILLDSALWILLLAVPLYYWKKSAAKLIPLTLGLCLLMVLGIAETRLNGDKKLPIQLTRYEVLENVRFHPQNNIIVMVLDSVPFDVAKTVLKNNSDLADKFSDFIFFNNVIGASPQTIWAIPSMLAGEPYRGGNYLTFLTGALEAPSSLSQTFNGLGYDVYLSSMLPQYNMTTSDSVIVADKNSSRKTDISLPLYCQLSFSFMPYFTKYLTENYLTAFLFNIAPEDKAKKSPSPCGGDKNIYEKCLFPAINSASSDKPTIHFHHLYGAHSPFVFQKDGSRLPASEAHTSKGLHEQTEWVLRTFSKLLDELRQNNLYEDATLIFVADHGDTIPSVYRKIGPVNTIITPVFMVKPAGRKDGGLIFSDIPVSNADITRLLLSTHVDGNGENLDSFASSINGRRRFYIENGWGTLRMVKKEGALAEIEMERIEPNNEATVLLAGKEYLTNLAIDVKPDSVFAHPEKTSEPVWLAFAGYAVGTKGKNEFYFKVEGQKNFVDLELGLVYSLDMVKAPWLVQVADANTGQLLSSVKLTPQRPDEMFKVVIENVSVKDGSIGIKFLQDHPASQGFALGSIKVL